MKLCDSPVNFGYDVRINIIDINIIRSVLLSTTSATYKETFASSPVVERFKKESMTGFFVHRDKKRSHCREVVVSGGSTVLLASK